MPGLLYRLRPIKAKIASIEPFYQEAERVLRSEGQEFETLFNSFFQSWDGKPQVVSVLKMDRSRGIGGVFTHPRGDERLLDIIRWIIYGTPEHEIPLAPKQFPDLLRYPGTFVPKTSPGVIPAGPGGKFGEYVYATQVTHPGITPRNTTELIKQRRAHPFFKHMEAGMKIALRKAMAGAR